MTPKKTTHQLLPPLWVVFWFLLFLAGWILWNLKELVVFLLMGYSIAYVIEPLVQRLEKKGLSRAVSFCVIFVVVGCFFVVLGLTAAPVLYREFARLSENFASYLDLAKERLAPMLKSFQGSAALQNQLDVTKLSTKNLSGLGDVSSVAGPVITNILQGLGTALLGGYSITLAIVNFFLLPFIAFYLSVDFQQIHAKTILLFPRSVRKKIREIVGEIDINVSAYIRGQLLVCIVLFFMYLAGLLVIGVELALVLAFIAGFGNMIPYFGFLAGIILSAIMALVTFGDLSSLLLVLLLFVVVQCLEGTVITPKIVGNQVGLSPLSIILALFAGGQLFGLLGIFLAVPFAAALKVLLRELHAWLVRASEAEAEAA